jgi:hypothetical protein
MERDWQRHAAEAERLLKLSGEIEPGNWNRSFSFVERAKSHARLADLLFRSEEYITFSGTFYADDAAGLEAKALAVASAAFGPGAPLAIVPDYIVEASDAYALEPGHFSARVTVRVFEEG